MSKLFYFYLLETVAFEEAQNVLYESDLNVSHSDSDYDFCLRSQWDTNTSSDLGVEESGRGSHPDLAGTAVPATQRRQMK